jgi:hypothetical protein
MIDDRGVPEKGKAVAGSRLKRSNWSDQSRSQRRFSSDASRGTGHASCARIYAASGAAIAHD